VKKGNYILIIGLFLVTGCSPRIEGNYTLLADGAYGNVTVSLKYNNTFNAIVHSEMGLDKFSKGEYNRIKGRHVLLKSDCDCHC
jgi:hypothetical protein